MPAHTVKLILEGGDVTYVSPNKARRLLKRCVASIVSQQPFTLRLKAGAEAESEEWKVQRWTSVSGGMLMNGSLLQGKTPRP